MRLVRDQPAHPALPAHGEPAELSGTGHSHSCCQCETDPSYSITVFSLPLPCRAHRWMEPQAPELCHRPPLWS